MDLGQKQTLQFCYRNIEIKLLPITFCCAPKSMSSSVIIRIAFSCNNSEKYRHPIWQHAEIERPWDTQLLILCLHEISPIRPQGTWWKKRQKDYNRQRVCILSTGTVCTAQRQLTDLLNHVGLSSTSRHGCICTSNATG